MRIAILPMLLLAPLAFFAKPVPALETPRVAADAFEARNDFPPPFAGKRAGMELATKALSGELPGWSGQAQAPLAAQPRGADPSLVSHVQPGYRGLRGACDHSTSDLCYDLVSRRVVYRPVRQYMPTIDGLTPENISLHRDSIHFRYSFR
jgi:hypothetical protein